MVWGWGTGMGTSQAAWMGLHGMTLEREDKSQATESWNEGAVPGKRSSGGASPAMSTPAQLPEWPAGPV